MILSGQLAGEEEVRRFHSEAEAAALLDHPNVVPVFDVGEYNGRHFFSMAYVDGQSLTEQLKDGPLAPTAAVRLMIPIVDALACAHQRGIIHRDLKPSNVMVDSSGVPRVTDFGLARQLKSDSNLTATGQVMGTPSYMPPEQAAGETAKIDQRADIYSLGAILYTLVTGRPPFQAAHVVETLRQVLERDPVEPRSLNPDIDRDLETICLKCLNKEPEQRYKTADELREELSRRLDGRPIQARSVTRTERVWRWCRRNRLVAGLTGTAAVSLIAGTIISIYFAILAEQRAAQAETGVSVALIALESTIDKIQSKLRLIPAAQEIRRELLRDAMDSLQKISGQVQLQSRVDVNSAKALVDLGLLFVKLGDDDGLNSVATAEANFRAAVRIFRELVPDDEPDSELLRNRSWAACECGSFLLDENRLDEAEPLLKEALTLRRTLYERSPDDPAAQYRLSYSLTDWADLLSARRQFEPSISVLEEALQLAEQAETTHQNHDRMRDHVIHCIEKLGNACHGLRQNDLALSYFEHSLEMSLQMREERPEMADRCNAVSYGYEQLGNHYLQTANPTKALEMYLLMEEKTLQAIELDPRNRILRDGLSVAYEKLASAYRLLGQVQAAQSATAEATRIRRELSVK